MFWIGVPMTDIDGRQRRRSVRPFNSPLEYALRTLFILNASPNSLMDLQRIVAYDYLIVHSGDIENGPRSLHPAVPYRGTELLVKRELIQAGLNQLIAKELARIDFVSQGFLYSASELTGSFVGLLSSPYALELRCRAEWVENRFRALGNELLQAYITHNVGRWGAEFEALTALASLEL